MARKTIRPMPAPVNRALVFVCERCGKRAGRSKEDSYRLASNLKRAAKREWGKGEVRVVMTSCMDACPEHAISVSILPVNGDRTPLLIEADVDDLDAAGEALLRLVTELTL